MSNDFTKIKLYHMTEIDNLSSILSTGCLLSNKSIRDNCVNNTSIANQSVQSHREETQIYFPPNGTLHEYVPFYFAPRSPMLYAIYKNNVDTYCGDQSRIIYLCTNVQIVLDHSYQYVFTDGHAIVEYTQQYNNVNELFTAIDWELMKAKFWNNTDEDRDRKRRRQAEFLIYRFFNMNDVTEIAVKETSIRNQVQQLFAEKNFLKPIQVKPEWYF